jgi:peptidase M28-like protein
MGWDMRGGELWVESAAGEGFKPYRLCRYSDAPMCVATYSKGGDWSGEMVEVGSGLHEADYTGKDVKGKVVLASGYAGNVVREAVLKYGAVGAVIYPAPTERPEHPYMVRYNGIWPHKGEEDKTRGAFMISANQYAELKKLMKAGAVHVHGTIDASYVPGQLTLVHAWIRGNEKPNEEVLITGHLDHPKWSANDNASGSAAMIEVARTLQTLIKTGRVPAPRRTIHFIWVPEYYGTIAYIAEHPEMRRCGPWDDPRPAPAKTTCAIADLNMDMVGEDTVKTNGRFYFTRTPDSVPSFLDALLEDVLQQTREADLYAPTGSHNYWPTEIVPYVQGSDHDMFLGIGVPSTMLGHDPDWTHHTSEDTVDKTDASELLRVGVFATAAAEWMASADGYDWTKVNRRADVESSVRKLRLGYRSQAAGMTPTGEPEVLGGSTSRPPRGPTVPHRLTLLPIAPIAFADLTGDDKTWWDQQEGRFGGYVEGKGLPTEPTFDLVVYETVNFMDGHRSTADIAQLLSAEYLRPFDQAFLERVVKILAERKLVALPGK